MRLLKLSLRGSIGIKKGLGIDEIEIDYSQFSSGIIAFVAKNGRGKTTIMDNSQPFRVMPSRDGTLPEHFFLKDSYRFLTVEHNGGVYEFKILIDAINSKQEAYAYKDGEPLNDGKLKTYDAVVESLFGSEQLFFNSVFSAQKTQGIAALTPGDRKRLFFELLGLDKYEDYSAYAKSMADELEKQLTAKESELNTLKPEHSLEHIHDKIAYYLGTKSSAEEQYSVESQKLTEFQAHKAELEQIEKQQETVEQQNSQLVQEIKEVNSRLNQGNFKTERDIISLSDERHSIELQIKSLSEKRQNIAQYQEDVKSLTRNRELLEKSHANIRKLSDEKQEMLSAKAEFDNEAAQRNSRCSDLKSEISRRENELYWMEQNKNNYERSNDLLESIPCGDKYPTCQFIAQAFKDKKSAIEISELIPVKEKELKQQLAELELENAGFTAKMQQSDSIFSEKIKLISERISSLMSEEKLVTAEIERLSNAPKLLESAQNADNQILVLEEKLKSVNIRIQSTKEQWAAIETELNAKLERLQADLEKNISQIYVGIEAQIKDVNYKIVLKQSALESIQSSINQAISSLSEWNLIKQQTEQILDKIEKLKPVINKIQNDLSEWRFLQKAYGKAGIPIMKLEHSAALVTATTNDLLQLFDRTFRVKINTMTLKSDNKSFKEVFDILVLDNGEPTELANKSGGQQVWIESALQMAIAHVVRKSGKNIKTAFLDEKDGALDLENAHNYIQMVMTSGRLSGIEQTFLITHRPELLDMIPQQIHLSDRGIEIHV